MQFYLEQNSIGEPKVVVIFGLGLIGKSIAAHLESSFVMLKERKMRWESAEDTSEAVRELIEFISSYHLSDTHIVWSAGIGSFSASKEAFEPEIQVYRQLLKSLQNVETNSLHFHLMSSAGALYAGQTSVKRNSEISPNSDYGIAKMTMEQDLEMVPYLRSFVYRISTVYGYDLDSSRKGLITTMLMNGIKSEVTTIFGNMDTLRDYINVEDIGEYVSQMIVAPTQTGVHFLISGKPTSIGEIKSSIERTLKRKLMVSYKLVNSNAANICFEQSLIPNSFKPTSLLSGINQLYLKIQQYQQ